MGVLQYIATRNDISKTNRLTFYIDVMKKEQNLYVLEIAGHEFTTLAGLQIKPLAVKYLLKWWEENKDTLKD